MQRLTIALSHLSERPEFDRALRELGVDTVTFAESSGDTGAVSFERWSAQLSDGEFDHIVFASAQGVRLVIEMASPGEARDRLLRSIGQCHIVARGKLPAQALAEFGVRAHVVVEGSSVDAILTALEEEPLENKAVGLQPFDKNQEEKLAEAIAAAGGNARLVAPTTTVDPEATRLLERIAGGQLGAVGFLSERSAAWMFDACRVSGKETHLVRALRTVFVMASEEATVLLRRRGVHPHLVLSETAIACPDRAHLAAALGLGRSTHAPNTAVGRERVVVVGNGMVGYKVCEQLTEHVEARSQVSVVALGDEAIPAYDRVNLSSYFSGKTAKDLMLAQRDWYADRGIDLRLSSKVTKIDRESRMVMTASGDAVPYDTLVLAMGAGPFVPPIPGTEKKGVFVYRTIDDLDAMMEFARRCESAAVIGGGLLGLEAAKAAMDLGLETHVVEVAPRLMPRQLDEMGAALLRREIEGLGLKVHVGRRTTGIAGDDRVTALCFADGDSLGVDMIIISAGIKPRDALAKEAGIKRYERGGIVVDDRLRTSDKNIYAVGECAIHEGTLYGLVAPGFEMASAVAKTILGEPTKFTGTDMSTKLKLLGVDVASLGDPFADSQEGNKSVVYHDLLAKVYKKLIVDESGTRLLGAILVGDTSEYGQLLPYAKSGDPLPLAPDELLFGSRAPGGGGGLLPLPDTAQICSCNNVSKLDIIQAIDADPGCTIASVKKCTKAGTGCGGCMPIVTDIFDEALLARGQSVKKHVCEHFEYTRQELFDLVRVERIKSFDELIAKHGRGHGCEVCKPVAGSIFATTGTDPIIEHQMLQDTNDRFLANIQRKGLYSVIPRIPGGEITPEKLIVIGQVAKKYGLYTKITGGQRIDLFGARVDQLPDIWEELIAAGFESGHAYAKSLRTVKSCVGSTWCRYGVGDSVGFAIRVENRYKGLRSPHKLKSAVSGCTRECAEAQGKDFGLIATEQGYNLYVCGNGGTKPRHAELLAADIDEDTAIRYIDRFLMYYIRTADKLQRTAVWLDKIEGGIQHVKDVVVKDSLGIAKQLEADIQKLIDGYVCEWRDVVENPEKRELFRHFAGEDKAAPAVELVPERGQGYPPPWPKEPVRARVHLPVVRLAWRALAKVDEIPENGGTAVRYGEVQLAAFNFQRTGEWFVTQNLCPHKREMILSRGLLGDSTGKPKVACPFHKKTFDLETGAGISDEELSIATFPTKVEDGWLHAELPSEAELAQAMRVSGCVEDCASAAE